MPEPRYTINEVLAALAVALPSPRTQRDCVIETRLRAVLADSRKQPAEN